MSVRGLLAQLTVADLAAAEDWYRRLFGRGPDIRPMDGLIEWHLSGTFGVQVWREPARAGNSCVVLEESDLEERMAALDAEGIEHPGIQPATATRLLSIVDPEGNRIVFTGP